MIKITNFQCWARILHFRIFLEPFTSNYPCNENTKFNKNFLDFLTWSYLTLVRNYDPLSPS